MSIDSSFVLKALVPLGVFLVDVACEIWGHSGFESWRCRKFAHCRIVHDKMNGRLFLTGTPFIYHVFNALISTFTANEYYSGFSHLDRKSFVATSASIGRFFKIPATSITSAAAFNARSVIRPSRL